MNFLPGWGMMMPAANGAVAVPASYGLSTVGQSAFLGLTDRGLTSATVTGVALSYWMKAPNASDTVGRFILNSSNGIFDWSGFSGGDAYCLGDNGGGGNIEWGEDTSAQFYLSDNAWHHYAVLYDSSQGTADNRLRFYRDGSLIADANSGFAGGSAPGASEDSFAFKASQSVFIFNFGGQTADLAFIQCIRGTPAITDLAFNDGGTWTHMAYAGSHGVGGFLLDGVNGLTDSVSGYAFDDAADANLITFNTEDLPPYIV